MRYQTARRLAAHCDPSILPANPAKDQKELITKTKEWVRKHPDPCNPFRKQKKQ